MSTQIDMIGLFVEDLPRMAAFYRDVLGFELEWSGNGPYAEFDHAGVRFSMYERKHLPALLGQIPDFPARLNGTFELAIEQADDADVDREYSRIVDAGGQPVYAPRGEPWGMRSAMIADPEGNLIEITSHNR